MALGIVLLALALLVAAQLVPINRVNPAVNSAKTIEAATVIPPEVHGILQRSCNDCHSYETVWPWYSRVAPVSWVVAYDVREGRDDLNFSEWTAYSTKEQGDKLYQMCARVRREEMPDVKYTLIHRNAILTPDQRNALCAWVDQTRKTLGATTSPALPGDGEVRDR